MRGNGLQTVTSVVRRVGFIVLGMKKSKAYLAKLGRSLVSPNGVFVMLCTCLMYFLYSSVSLVRLPNIITTTPPMKCPYLPNPSGDPPDLDARPFWGKSLIFEDTDVLKCPQDRSFKVTTDDILCLTPPTFLPNYKNPCWKSLERKGLQCLPYFQVIGVDKCGSTDLFSRISKHPDVARNTGVLNKETQWWPWKRYGHMTISGIKKEWFHDYLDYFNKSSVIIDKRKNATGYRHVITGDGTPMDFWDMTGWKQIPQNYGLKEPKYVTPHLIRHVNPDVKLILIFRDPVVRVFSDYFFLKLCEQSTQGFHDSVEKSIQELTRCRTVNSLRSCLYNRTLHLHMKARIHLSFYATYMKEWLSVFPRQQFLIFRTEEFAKDVADHLKRAFEFLGLRQLPEGELLNISALGRAHVTKNEAKKKPMFKKTRKLLEDLFRPENQELSRILKDDYYRWNL